MSERTTYRMEIDAEHMRNIFGEEDHYIQKIEKETAILIRILLIRSFCLFMIYPPGFNYSFHHTIMLSSL